MCKKLLGKVPTKFCHESKRKLTESLKEFPRASAREKSRESMRFERSGSGRGMQLCLQVPISQEARYFFCSCVNVSMTTPMPASLSRAISLSIAGGTGYTFFSRSL